MQFTTAYIYEFTIANFTLDCNSILKQRTHNVEAEQEIAALENTSEPLNFDDWQVFPEKNTA